MGHNVAMRGGGTQILLYVTDWISVYSVKAVQEHFILELAKYQRFSYSNVYQIHLYEDNTYIWRKETYQTFQKNDILEKEKFYLQDNILFINYKASLTMKKRFNTVSIER